MLRAYAFIYLTRPMKKKLALISSALLLAPFSAFAQIDGSSAGGLGQSTISFINNVAIPLVFALAFIVFIFGVFRYFIAGGNNEEARDQGKQLIIFGIIGFFVMVSVWGMVHFLTGTVAFSNNSQNALPQVTSH